MDISAVQSFESISSSDVRDANGASCLTKNPSEFVNHGLILWNETRQKWLESKLPQNQTNQLLEPKLRTLSFCSATKCWPRSWDTNYESVLNRNKPYRRPIPLSEMVDFLVDIWEMEGMYG